MQPQGTELAPDPHQMSLDGAPAVHQPIHHDQESLLGLIRPCNVTAPLAELSPLDGKAKASDPKVDLHFWDLSDAFFLDESIGESGKPGPLFRTML